MAKNVSDLLVEMLYDAGVRRVYAITGDSLNPVNDAIRRDGRIEWIHVRHEEAGAYAASMDAEINGIGCCMGSSGPGHVHLINGLYDANRAGNPVIAIASTILTSHFGQDHFQETNPILLFQDCSKYVQVANTPEQVQPMLQQAIQAAKEMRGVAVLGLPGDVASADAAEVFAADKNFDPKTIYRPADEDLQKLAKLIKENKKIGLYCGYGCKDAIDEVMQLARKLNAPMAYSFRGKIFFDRDQNEFACGMNGLLGHKSGYKTCNEADVLLLLGTDFPYVDFLPKKNIMVQIDRKPSRIGRRGKVDMALAGNMKDTLQALLPLLEEKTDTSFLEEMRKEYHEVQEHEENFTVVNKDEKKIHPEYAAYLINKLAADNAIFTVDTGMTSVWAARFIRGKQGRYLTGSFNHGSMANAMPMAIGAAASQKDRQVVAMCGDGGISMLFGDLFTIVQYQLPVKIIVFNNRALGMVKLEMEVAGYVDWQTDMVNPEFDKLADAMGMKGIAVKEAEHLEGALTEAFATPGPVLVNIYTDPEALAMPPHITVEQMMGFTQSMVRKVGLGKFDEIGKAISSNIKHLGELL